MQDSNKKSRKHGFNTYSVFLIRKFFKEFDVYMNDAFCTNYRPQRSWGKVIFSEACVNNSVHRGGHAWLLGGVCVVALGVCVVLFGGVCVVLFGGMHGFIRGACMVLFGGHAWVYLGGHTWFYSGGAWFYSGGACMVLFRGGVRGFQFFSDTMRYGQ